jgi:hypothetical protein
MVRFARLLFHKCSYGLFKQHKIWDMYRTVPYRTCTVPYRDMCRTVHVPYRTCTVPYHIVPDMYRTLPYRTGHVPYLTILYRTCTVPYHTVPYPTGHVPYHAWTSYSSYKVTLRKPDWKD